MRPLNEQALFADLDQWQRQVVACDAPSVLVQAQVGSGKTTVLVRRVLWLQARGVPLSRIAVLTFTNRAAADFRRRVAAMLPGGELEARQLRLAGTFHAVCRTLLARNLPIETLGFRRDFSVLDVGERDAMWQQLIAEHRLQIRHKRQLAKRMAALEEGVVLHGTMRKPDDIVQLAELAHAEKLRRNAMDFDDLLRNTHALLCEHPLNPPLGALLIDELQDCDREQLDLAERLCGEGTEVLAVGDPNQVIYSWRGTAPEIMTEFAQRTGAQLLTLPMNYRCPEAILEPARMLVQEAGPPVAPPSEADDMVAAQSGGKPIVVMPCHDSAAQARWITARVQAWREEGAAVNNIAVLCRSRRGLGPVVRALREAELPVREQVADRARDMPVVAWLLHVLRWGLGDAGDDHHLVSALVDRKFGRCPEKPMSSARWEDGEGEGERWRVVLETAQGRSRGRMKGHWRACLEAAARWRLLGDRALATGVTSAALAEWLDLDRALQPTSSSFTEDRDETLAFLTAWLDEIDASEARDRDGLQRALAVVAESQPALRPPQGVSALTMHASKGLEFRHVVIIDANDGWIPLSSAWRSPEQLAEERRLLFVAMTRASESVHICWLRAPGDPRAQGDPSPFLELLPPDAMNWLDHPANIPKRATQGPAASSMTDRDKAPTEAARGHEKPGFSVGSQVRHRRYGVGEVVEVLPDAVVARFANIGNKRFSLAMCPLRPE